jgi:hypothetical protein
MAVQKVAGCWLVSQVSENGIVFSDAQDHSYLHQKGKQWLEDGPIVEPQGVY